MVDHSRISSEPGFCTDAACMHPDHNAVDADKFSVEFARSELAALLAILYCAMDAGNASVKASARNVESRILVEYLNSANEPLSTSFATMRIRIYDSNIVDTQLVADQTRRIKKDDSFLLMNVADSKYDIRVDIV